MTDKTKIIDELNNSTNLLIDSISQISENDFNTRTDERTWSVGDICEHIIKIETSVNRLITTANGNTERNPAEKVDIIRDRFEDFEIKFKAGAPVEATNTHKDKKEMIGKIKECRNELIKIINESDIDKLCMGFEHGIFGYLTGVEWIYYNISHTNRHTQQMQSRKDIFSTGR